MSGSTDIRIGITVDDGGTTKDKVKDVSSLAKGLDGVTAAATRAGSAVKAAMAPSGGSKTVGALKGASQSPQDSIEYGQARAAVGTGAAGRDFAKQAQGLGGLVHVYATFAANLFAVSAAFTALSAAADTTNMVKGLDQLSVSSGKSLGSLSKQLAQATDGAISMSEAMTAVAQSSAAGLTSANILRLGEVAKKASQALGLSMPDAISRLSRGISKIEPELLDELGIFVKVDKASQDYARTLGKSVSTLTDFEKRQGFANAVLAQAEEKFSNIKIDANPYAKLLASMKDLAQTGLELVNKVLTPIVGILSSSPAALATVMGTIGVMLIKQAIPALAQYKEYLNGISQASAEQAKARMEMSRSSAAKEYSNLVELARKRDTLAGDVAEKEFLTQKTTVDKINALQKTRVNTEIVGPEVRGLLKKSIYDLSPADLNAIKDRAAVLLQSDNDLHVKQGTKLYNYLEKTNKMYVEADNVHQQAVETSIKTDLAGNKQLQDSRDSYGKLNQKYAIDSIKASALDTQAKEGTFAALKKVNAELGKARQGTLKIEGVDEAIPKISLLERVTTTAGVAFDLSKAKVKDWASKLGDSLDKLGMIGQVLGLAIGAFELLDNVLSTGAKEIDKYNSNLEATRESTKLLKSVANDLSNQDSSKFLSPESMTARSNSINEASVSIKGLLKTLNSAQFASNWWDNLFDGLFSKSRLQKTADSIVASIKEAIKLARPSAAKDVFAAKVLEITGAASIDTVSTSDLTKEKLAELSAVYDQFGAKLAKSSADINAPKKSFELLNKTFQDLSATLLPTDNISKYAMALVDAGISLKALSGDTDAYFEQLRSLANSNLEISLLGLSAQDSKALQDVAPELDRISIQYNALTKAVEAANIVIDENTAKIEANAKIGEKGGAYKKQTDLENKVFKERADANQKTVDNATVAITKLTQEKADFNQKFIDISTKAITNGLDLFGKSLNLIIEQGTLKLAGAIAGNITGVGSSDAKTAVALKEIDLRVAGNNIMADLIIEQQKATLALEANTAQGQLELVTKKLDLTYGDKLSKADRLTAEKTKSDLEGTLKTLSSAQTILSGSNKSNLLANVGAAAKTGGTESAAAGILKNTAFGVAKVGAENAAAGEEKKAVLLNDALGKTAEKYTVLNRASATRVSLLEIEYKDASQLANMSNSFVLQELANQKAVAIEKEKANTLTNESLKLEDDHKTKLEAASKAGSLSAKLTADENKSYEDQKVALQEKLKVQNSSNKAAQLARDLSDIAKKNAIEIYRLDGLKLANDQKLSQETGRVQNQLAELEALRTTESIQEKYYLTEKAVLDQRSLIVEKAKELSNLEDAKTRSIIAANGLYSSQLQIINQSTVTEAKKATSRLEAQNQLIEATSRANSIAAEGTALSNAKFATDSKILAQTSAYNIELERQNQLLATITGISESLKTIFGDLGDSVGKAGEALLKMSQDDDKYAKQKLAVQKKINAVEESGDTVGVDLMNEKMELDKKSAKSEISNMGAVAGATKNMFKEKTFAYKAFAAFEKAMAVIKLATLAAEITGELGLTALSVAASGTRAGAKGTESIVNAMKDLPTPLNFIAGAAMAAIIAELIGSSKGVSPPAIDQGTLAGTGQQVGPDGQTIGTRIGGVVGDPKAEAKSISSSIDELSKVFFNNLGSTSSNLIQSLKGIQENTYNTAKALGAAGVIGGGTNPFGIATGGGSGGLIDSVVGAIFGSTKTSITGAGFRGEGTLAELSSGQSKVTGYTNVVSRNSGFLGTGIGGGSSSSTVTTGLGSAADEAFKGLFASFKSALGEVGIAFGKSTQEMDDYINATRLSIQVSTQGLTATEAKQKLEAELSVQLNKQVIQTIPFIETYTKAGDEYLTVAANLVKAGETVNFGLKMVGAGIDGLAGMSEGAVAQQQQIIKNFGGTADLFASAIQGYYDALFSDSEKAAIGTTNVQKQLAALGQTGITTNAQLKDLIATIDPTTKLYADLVKLVPAFADANAATQKLTDSIGDQEAAIYNLLGKPTKALEISRAKELAALDATLRPRQVYVNALTDEIALRDKLKAAYNTTNSSLTNSIKTLYDYKNALTAGANSTLTPSEKYAQAKSIFMQTAAAAQAAITANSSAADIAARDAALSKIQSTGDALLGASKEVNASGIQYAADFASVSSTVDKTSEILAGQQTDLQKQVGFLDTIAEATTTTAQLITDYLAARDKTSVAQQSATDAGSTAATVAIPGHARGGLAKGVSLVGENGPEVVDFKNPGRVYSNQASNDLFNTKELVAEIKALRNEVAQLRDDQNKQTGAIINSTFEANAQNAEAITTATQTAASNQDWKTRSQVRVA